MSNIKYSLRKIQHLGLAKGSNMMFLDPQKIPFTQLEQDKNFLEKMSSVTFVCLLNPNIMYKIKKKSING